MTKTSFFIYTISKAYRVIFKISRETMQNPSHLPNAESFVISVTSNEMLYPIKHGT